MIDPSGIRAFHASSVIANGKAWVFLGPSGTGKSTIVGLLEPYFEILADDAVYLMPLNSTWHVCKADGGRVFYHPLKKERVQDLDGPELGGFFRLFKSRSTYIVSNIDMIEAVRHLTNAFFEIDRHRLFGLRSKKQAFTDLVNLANYAPTSELYFSLAPQTLSVVAPHLQA
jgi:hypothetical protein